jgi:hypothetical protein
MAKPKQLSSPTQPRPPTPPGVDRDARPRGVRSSMLLTLAIAGIVVLWAAIILKQNVLEASADRPAITRAGLVFSQLLVLDNVLQIAVDGGASLQGVWERGKVLGVTLLTLISSGLFGLAWNRVTQSRVSSDVGPPAVGPPAVGPIESIAIHLAIGLAIQSALIATLGSIGWLYAIGPLLLALASMAAVAAEASNRRRILRDASTTSPSSENDRFPLGPDPDADDLSGVRASIGHWLPTMLAKWLVALGIVMLALRGMIPSADFDVREYHLQAPKEWFQSGRISFLPHNIYASMPLAAESHAMVSMSWWAICGGDGDGWWWGAMSGKLILAIYLMLAASIAGCTARQLAGNHVAPWVQAIVLWMPQLHGNASFGLNESALACYVALAHWSFIAQRSRPRAWTVGLCVGAMVACKYTSVVLLAPWPILWICVASAKSNRWRQVTVVLLAAMIIATPWLMKNFVQTGNPVYPLAARLLGGETMDAAKIQQWNAAHAVPPTWRGREGEWQLLQGVRILTQSLRKLTDQLPLQSGLLLPLAAVGMVLGWRHASTRAVTLSILFGIALWWMLTHRLERFVLPAVPLLASIAGIALARVIRSPLAAIPLAVLLLDAVLCLSGFIGDPRWLADLSAVRRDASQLPQPIARLPAHVRWVNENAPADARLLLIGDAAAFDYELPVAYSTCFDASPLWTSTAPASSTTTKDPVSLAPFTHLVVVWSEIDRYRSPGNYGFDARITPALFQSLIASGQLRVVPVPSLEPSVTIFAVVKGNPPTP